MGAILRAIWGYCFLVLMGGLKNGEWQMETMERMRVHDTDVTAAARGNGIKTLDQVKYAILERQGAIVTIEKE